MKTRILVLALLNVLAAFAVASAGGQAQWGGRAVQGGVEFRLLNDEGDAIVLRCADQEVHAGFVVYRADRGSEGRPGNRPACGRGTGPHPPATRTAELPGRSDQPPDRSGRHWSRARLYVGSAGRCGEHPRADRWWASVFRGGGQRLDARAVPGSGREIPCRLRSIGLRQVGGNEPRHYVPGWEPKSLIDPEKWGWNRPTTPTMTTFRRLNQ